MLHEVFIKYIMTLSLSLFLICNTSTQNLGCQKELGNMVALLIDLNTNVDVFYFLIDNYIYFNCIDQQILILPYRDS